MGSGADRLRDRQHLLVALLCLWLILTSPWIGMHRRIPEAATWLDWAHVGLGFAVALLAVTYTATCARGGTWRQYLPLSGDGPGAIARDLGGLVRGRIPSAGGAGLFSLIEGLLLLALLATAATGVAWFVLQGTDSVLAWRRWHVVAVRGLVGLIVLHLVAVSLHLVELIRD